MNDDSVLYEVEGHVATITMNRPTWPTRRTRR